MRRLLGWGLGLGLGCALLVASVASVAGQAGDPQPIEGIGPEELGTRQATISEWENGLYQPRGASARLLNLVAERVGFDYGSDEQ